MLQWRDGLLPRANVFVDYYGAGGSTCRAIGSILLSFVRYISRHHVLPESMQTCPLS